MTSLIWLRSHWRCFGVLLLLTTMAGKAAPLPANQTLYDVTFGGGTFVAVGANGTIFSSVSGGEWALRTSDVTNDLRAVAFGGNTFVAAGANGTLVSSPDGVTWTVRSISAILSFPEIAYGNGRFVVGGTGPTGFWTMLVSTNGVDWNSSNTEAPAPQFGGGLPLRGLTFGAGKFLAIGGIVGSSLSLASTDGVVWKELGTDGMAGTTVGPLSYGNGRFATVAEWYDDDDDDGGTYHSLVMSDDGAKWNWTAAPISYGTHAILAANCTTIFTRTYPFAPGLASTVWFSHDLLDWQQIPDITNTINALAFGNGTFVGVGNDIVPLNIPPPTGAFPIVPATNYISLGGYASFQAGTPCLDPPVRYQWRLDGAAIPEATNLNYNLFNASADQAGNYTLVASNALVSITSSVSILTIALPPPRAPTVTSPETNTTIYFGPGQDASLSVAFDAWPLPTFQWRFNGVDILGATNSYLTLNNFHASAQGDYTVLVRNSLGAVLSPSYKILLGGPRAPEFQTSQTALVATEGSRVVFPDYYPYGAGLPPENSRVLKDGLDSGLPLGFFPSLALRQVALSDAGRYEFVSSNIAGSATSQVVNLTVVPGGPLDRWTQRNPLPQNDHLLKVTYAGGRFIAVGDRGAVVSSMDGTNWVSQGLRSELNLAGVAGDGSRFVAVGERSILTSSDGTNWIPNLVRADLLLQAVTFANNRFVVANGDGILTYTDALGWRDAVLPSATPRLFRDVAFGNGRWVAVGTSQGYYQPLWMSANGIDWTPIGGVTADFECVIFAGGQFLAAGDGGEIFTSPDGLIWTRRNSGVSYRLIGAAHGNGRYVVVGTRGRVLTSSIGVNWGEEKTGTPDRLESVAFGNGIFVAVGENGTTLSSINGNTWFRRSRGATRDLDGIALGNGLITVAGKGGTLLTSSNGANFVEQSTAVTNDLHGVAWANGLHVAVGEPGLIISSPNAVQWTPRNSGSSSSLKSVTSGGGRWVAVGTQGEILTSTDGAAWSPSTSPTINDLNGVAYGNGLFVVVGDNLPPNGTLLTSTDGLHWTRRNQYIGKNLRSVTFANGMFLATANDSMFMVSSNGINWELRGTSFWPYYGNLRAATYADGLWMITGNNGLILTSSDLMNWTPHPAPTFENLHGVVSLGKRFVTIGNRGIILQSDPIMYPPTLTGRYTSAGFEVFLSGQTGVTYQLEAADQLPSASWTSLGSFLLTQPGTNIVDSTATNSNQRFYRAVSP